MWIFSKNNAIGLGANLLSEIASRIKEPVTSLTTRFQHLLELDLIQKEIPYGSDEHNSKKTLYKIRDPFIRFWFEAVAPRRSAFFQASSINRIQWIQESLPSLFSLTWEELCRFAIALLSKKLGGKLFNPAGLFWQGSVSLCL